ncbi:CPBP family lipoprotein N-acylation protein LnsB [Staphylococcus borealis]|uniref:CPBP family lipoprotein N-acylation protein LnsB n=1 Tax=Staphylococcus borealis TaxID=2742203 RepID=UPI000D1E0DB6|nr:CPBP family lipoprotein N-acylation protein LnsB [Staphylococcus borealis]PTK68378.1 CPBP family intramembrane metalloprotease [Staphylococcus borealis]RIO72118.1 CPBP family intramembrane metalloprotease [Staphylococcus borealis]
MEKRKKAITHEVSINQWGSSQIVKKDFLLIPIYIMLQILVPIIIVFGVLGIYAMITQDPPPLYLYNLTLSISFVIAQFVVIVSFFALHKYDIADVALRQYRIAKRHYIPLIITVTLFALLLFYAINVVAQYLPKPIGYDITQAQLRLEGLFNHPSAIVFTFITMVVLQPLIQELIYRHLMIHELGKRLNVSVVIVLSIVIEVGVQVYDFISVMEVIPYSILSLGAIVIYMRTGKNLAASYLYHSSVQFILFIITMIERFF